MLNISNIKVSGWEMAIYGMRNPMNSWDKMDSYCAEDFVLGPNDLDLACRLIKAGPEHRKFFRMIHVQMNILGPLYWLKEFDTYKVGTVANSCSTMHKIAAKRFERDDFSHEHLMDGGNYILNSTIDMLNEYRAQYLETKDKKYWWQLIQLLPSSYKQLRTWDASLQTILAILKQRKGHKLDEWGTFREACLANIPYCQEFYNALTGDKN